MMSVKHAGRSGGRSVPRDQARQDADPGDVAHDAQSKKGGVSLTRLRVLRRFLDDHLGERWTDGRW